MKIKKWLLFVLVISITVFISCKKYLDKQSDNSFVVPGTLTDLQGLLDDADLMNELVTPSFGEASCDNYFEPIDIYNSGDDGSKATYTWQPHDYIAPNDWSSAYLPVYNSNYCLETLGNIPMNTGNEAMWKNVKGSALFFRASRRSLWLTVDVPRLPTAIPAARFEIRAALSRLLPAPSINASVATTVSPAPATSNTSRTSLFT